MRGRIGDFPVKLVGSFSADKSWVSPKLPSDMAVFAMKVRRLRRFRPIGEMFSGGIADGFLRKKGKLVRVDQRA